MSEAAEQYDENRELKEESQDLESDESGSLQRILGLEKMNHTLESQVAHVHGRMKDEALVPTYGPS